jgi:hypothetical protein
LNNVKHNKDKPINEKVSKFIEEELHWYFCMSDSECGYKSSWQACLNAACFGQAAYSDPYTTKILNAINSKKQIEVILRQLPEFNQFVLYSIYGHTFYNEAIEKVFKKLTGPACCLMAHDDILSLFMDLKTRIARKPNKNDKLVIDRLMKDAETVKKESLRLYAEAKRLLGHKPMIRKHF